MTYRMAMNMVLPLRIIITSLLFILSVGELFDGVLDAGDFAAPLLLALFINDVQNRPANNIEQVKQSNRLDLVLKIVIAGVVLLAIASEFYAVDIVVRKTLLKYSSLAWAFTLLFVSLSELKQSFNLMRVVCCHLAIGVIFLSMAVL